MSKSRTNKQGEYILQVKKAGKYLVSASACGYKAEYYNDAYTVLDADPVEVTMNEHTTGIDFGLVGQGSISGISGSSENQFKRLANLLRPNRFGWLLPAKEHEFRKILS